MSGRSGAGIFGGSQNVGMREEGLCLRGVSHPGSQVHRGSRTPGLLISPKMAVLRQLALLLWKNYTVQVGARAPVRLAPGGVSRGRAL